MQLLIPSHCFAAAYGNLVLLGLTIIMEVIVVCLLLSTLNRLPYQLEGKLFCFKADNPSLISI